MPGYPLPMMYYPPFGVGAFDLASAVQIGAKTTVVPGTTNQPNGCSFNDDGTEIFVTNGGIFGFTLVTPYETPGGTLGGNGNNSSFPAVTSDDITFSDDGLFLAVGSIALGIRTYTLTTPWVLTSGVSVLSIDGPGSGNFDISKSGLSVYYLGGSPGVIKKGVLSGYFLTSTSVEQVDDLSTGLGSNILGIAISADESRIYLVDNGTDTLYEYIMSTPGNLSTATPGATLAIGVSVVGSAPSGVRFSVDQSKMIVCAANLIPQGAGCVATFEGNVV